MGRWKVDGSYLKDKDVFIETRGTLEKIQERTAKITRQSKKEPQKLQVGS